MSRLNTQNFGFNVRVNGTQLSKIANLNRELGDTATSLRAVEAGLARALATVDKSVSKVVGVEANKIRGLEQQIDRMQRDLSELSNRVNQQVNQNSPGGPAQSSLGPQVVRTSGRVDKFFREHFGISDAAWREYNPKSGMTKGKGGDHVPGGSFGTPMHGRGQYDISQVLDMIMVNRVTRPITQKLDDMPAKIAAAMRAGVVPGQGVTNDAVVPPPGGRARSSEPLRGIYIARDRGEFTGEKRAGLDQHLRSQRGVAVDPGVTASVAAATKEIMNSLRAEAARLSLRSLGVNPMKGNEDQLGTFNNIVHKLTQSNALPGDMPGAALGLLKQSYGDHPSVVKRLGSKEFAEESEQKLIDIIGGRDQSSAEMRGRLSAQYSQFTGIDKDTIEERLIEVARQQATRSKRYSDILATLGQSKDLGAIQVESANNEKTGPPVSAFLRSRQQFFDKTGALDDLTTERRAGLANAEVFELVRDYYAKNNYVDYHGNRKRPPKNGVLLEDALVHLKPEIEARGDVLFGVQNRLGDDKAKSNFLSSVRQHVFDETTDGRGTIRTPKASLSPDLAKQFEVDPTGFSGKLAASTGGDHEQALVGMLSRLERSITAVTPSIEILARRFGRAAVSTTTESVSGSRDTSPLVTRRNRSFDPLSAHPSMSGVRPKGAMGNTETPLGDRWQDAFVRAGLYGSAATVLYGGTSQVYKGLSTINEFDKQMSTIRQVLNPLGADLKEISLSARQMGQEFGRSIQDTAEAMTIYAQMGKTQVEIIRESRVAMIGANVTRLEVVKVVEALTAAERQFGMSSSESMRIMDAWNEVSNTTGVTAEVLTKSLLNAGSVARSAGIDFDTFNGITAAVGEATRKSGEQIGTAMRFIFQNMRSPDAIRSLQEVGINTVSLEGNFLSARNAIGQLAGAWEGLTDVQRVNVAQSIAGTRRANDFIVLMETWDRAMDYTVTSLTSQGSAMRENDVAMESLSKKIEQLKASYEDLWVTLSDSGALDVLKNITDATSNLLKLMSGGASIGGGFLGSIVGIGGTIGASATGVGLIGQGLAAAQYTGMDIASRSGEKKTSIGRIVMAQQEAGAAAEVAASEAQFRKRLNSGATNQVAAMLGAGMVPPGDLTERQRDVLMRAQRRGGHRSFSLDADGGEYEGLTLAQRKGKMHPDPAPQPFLGGGRTMKLLGVSIGAQVARNAYHQMRPESPYGETDRMGQGIDMMADTVSSGALMSMFYKRRGVGGEPGVGAAIRRQGIGRSAAIGFLGTAMASNLYTQFNKGSGADDPDRVELNRLRAYRDRLGNTSGDLVTSIRSAKRGELSPQASGDLFDAVRAMVPGGGVTQTGNITSDLQVALQTIRGAEGSVRSQVSMINQTLARQTLNSDEVKKAIGRRDELDLEANRSTAAEPIERRLARLSEQYTLRETISGRLRPLMTAQAIEAGRSGQGTGNVDRAYFQQFAEALQSTAEQEARSYLGNFIRGAGGYGVDVNQLLGDRSAADTLGGDSYIQLDQEGGIFRLSDMQKVADTVEQWQRDTTLAGDHLLKAWEQIDTIAVTQPEDLSKLIGEYNETVRRLTGRNESILRHIEFLNDTLGQGFGGASGLITGASGDASARSIGALRSFEENGVRNFDGVSLDAGPQGIANAIREMIGEVRLASENEAGIALSGRANAVLKTVQGEQELGNSIRLFVDRFLTESNTGNGEVDEFSIEAVQAQLQKLLPNNFDEISRIKGLLSDTDTPEDRARLTERTYRLATQETRAKTRPDEDVANQLVTKGLQTYLTSFQTEMQSMADQFAFERTSNPDLTVDSFMSRERNTQTVADTRVVLDAINEAITQLRQTAADNDDRVGESAGRLALQFEATAASLKPLDDVAATLSSLADGADRLRGSLNRIGNLSQEGGAFGRTGVQSDQFEIDFLRREREKIVSGSGAYGDLTDGQRQTAAVDLQSRIRQAEDRISSTQGRRDLLRGGVSESVLNYRLESILGTGGGTGAKPFAEAAIEQLREAAQSIIADVSPDLTGLDDSQQSRILQQIADSLAPAGSAIRDLVNANGLGSRQDYLLSSPGNQAVADRVQELLRQGASVDEVFADPYARQAAQNNPLLRDLINKGLDTELQQAAIRLSQEGNEYLKDLPAIKALIARMVGGQPSPSATGYSRGTLAATGTPDVDASGRISKPEVMARLHQGEIVLTKSQSEEYLKNSFARGTLPRDPSTARGSMGRFGFPVLGNLDHPILDRVAEALTRLPEGFDHALGTAGFQLTVADANALSRFYKIDPREIVEDFGFFEPNYNHIAMVSSNVDGRVRNSQIAWGANTFAHEAGHAVDRARGRKLYPDAMEGRGYYRSEVMYPDVWDTMNGSRAQEVVDKIGDARFEREFFPPIYSKYRDEAFADAFAAAHGFKPGYAKTKDLDTFREVYKPAVDDALIQADKFTREYRAKSVDIDDGADTKVRSRSLRAKAIRDFQESIHGPHKVSVGSASPLANSLLSGGVDTLRTKGFAGLDARRAAALLDATTIGLGDLGDSTHAEFRTVFDTQNNSQLKTNKITLGSVRAHSKSQEGLTAAIIRKLHHEATHGALMPTSTHLIGTLFSGDDRAATMSRTQAILKKVWDQTKAKDAWRAMGAEGHVSQRYRDTKGLARYEEFISHYAESKGGGIRPDHPIGKLATANVDFLIGADGGSNVLEALKRGELTPDQARSLVLGNLDHLESMDFSSPGLVKRIVTSAGNRLEEGSRGIRSLYGSTRSSFGRMRGGTQQLLERIGQGSSDGLRRAGRFYNQHIEGNRIWGSLLGAGADLGARSLDLFNERLLVPGARAIGDGIGRTGDFLGSAARFARQTPGRLWGGLENLDLYDRFRWMESIGDPQTWANGRDRVRGLWSQAGMGLDRAGDWAADGVRSLGHGAAGRLRGWGGDASEYALSRRHRAQITASRMGHRAGVLGRRAMGIGGRMAPGAIRALGLGSFGLEIGSALGYVDLDKEGAMSTIGIPGAFHAAQIVDLQQFLYGDKAARSTFTGLNLRDRVFKGGADRLRNLAPGSRFDGMLRRGSLGLRRANRLVGAGTRAAGKGLLAYEALAAGNFVAGLGYRGAHAVGLTGENFHGEVMGAQASVGTMLNQPFELVGAGIQSTFNAATGAGFDGSIWQGLRGRNDAINTYQVALQDSLVNEGTRGKQWGSTSAFLVSQAGSLFGVDRAIAFADDQRVASIKDTTIDLNRIFSMPIPTLADAGAYTMAADALREGTGEGGGASTGSPLRDRHDQLVAMLDGDGTNPGLREAIEAYTEFNRGYGDQVPQENRDRLQEMRDRVKAYELERDSLKRFVGAGTDDPNDPRGQAYAFAQTLRESSPEAYAAFMRRSTLIGLQRAARSTGVDLASIDSAQMDRYASFAESMPPSTTLSDLLEKGLGYSLSGKIPAGRDRDWGNDAAARGDGANAAWVDHIRDSLKTALNPQQIDAVESHWKKQSELMRASSGSSLGLTDDFEDLGAYQNRWQALTASMSRVGSGSPQLVSDIDRLLQEVGSPLVGDGDELKLQENIRRVSRAISRDLFPRYSQVTEASNRLPTEMDALLGAFTSLPHDTARRRAYPPYAGGKVTAEQLVGVDRMPTANMARDAWARLQQWQQSAYGNTGQLSEYARQTSLLRDSDARQQGLDSTFQINRVRDERGRLLTQDPLTDKYAFGTTRLELEAAIRRDQIQLRGRQRLSRGIEGRLGLVSRVLDNEGTTNSDRFWQLIGRVGTPALATLGRQYVDLTGQIDQIQSSSGSGDSAEAQGRLAELMRRRNDLSDPSMNGGRDYDRALLQAILTMHRQLKAGGGTDTAAGSSRYQVDNASVSDSIDRIAQGTRHAGGMLTPEFNYLAKTGEAIVPQKHFDEFMSEATSARDSLYSQSSGRDTMRDDADQYMASQGHDGGRVQHDVRGEVNVTADSGFEGLMRQMIDAVNRQVAGGGSPARGQRIPRQLSSEG